MVETVKKLYEEVDELSNICMRNFEISSFVNMGEDEFRALKTMFGLLNTCKELSLKQAEMLENMNRKIDELYKKKRE